MKKPISIILVLAILICMLSSFTLVANADVVFTDVENGKWYKKQIDYAVENGIFSGTSATTFSPNTNMTRAQFVQVFANISSVDTSNKNVSTQFSDVPAGKWYTAAVKWAAENGVVNGMGNGTFAPEQPVTREQMCVMLVNYVEKYQNQSLQESVNVQTFQDDAMISSWAKKSVYKCAKSGLVSGVGNNAFDPKGTTTRAQGATFFSNFHKYNSVHKHSYVKNITAPTCTAQGYTTYTCSCGDTYVDDYIQPSHNYVKYKCTKCGAVDKAHAYEYLTEWVKENGKAFGTLITYDYWSNDYRYSLGYNAQGDYIFISVSYYRDEYFCYSSVFLNSFFYGTSVGDISLKGYLDASTFTANSPISYETFEGHPDLLADMVMYTREEIIDLVSWFDWFLETYELGVDIKDLGFEKF